MSQTLLFDLVPQRRVWKVSEITEQIGELLEGAFRDVWIEGEVSNFRPAQSGHLYFTLKDSRSQIRCVCFRDQARLLKFRPEDGLHITAARLAGRLRAARRISDLRQPHRAGRPRRAAARLRAAQKTASGRRLIRRGAQKAAARAAALHRRGLVAGRRGHSRHPARAEAPLRQRPRAALSR